MFSLRFHFLNREMGDSLEARLRRLERRVWPSKRVTLVDLLSGKVSRLDPVRDKKWIELFNQLENEDPTVTQARIDAVIPPLPQDKASQKGDEPK